MPKRGKNYKEAAKLVDRGTLYEVGEAVELALQTSKAKFDETVEVHIKLGVDSRHADQQVRGAIVLPHGTGKTKRVLVFAKGEKVKEAEQGGAEFVGGEELADKIKNENWFDFDVVVATPDMMGTVGKLGKILGPKGLMPNPKSGTVTFDIERAIKEIKAGKLNIVWIKPTSFTAHLEKFPLVRKRSRKTSVHCWKQLLRQSLLLQKVSI